MNATSGDAATVSVANADHSNAASLDVLACNAQPTTEAANHGKASWLSTDAMKTALAGLATQANSRCSSAPCHKAGKTITAPPYKMRAGMRARPPDHRQSAALTTPRMRRTHGRHDEPDAYNAGSHTNAEQRKN